jgi:hypothetical protein
VDGSCRKAGFDTCGIIAPVSGAALFVSSYITDKDYMGVIVKETLNTSGDKG